MFASLSAIALSKAALPAAAAPHPVLKPFSFKASTLGQSLDEWRAAPPPTESFPNVRPVCLGDQGAPTNDRRTTPQKAANVVQCGYSAPDASYPHWSGGHIGGYDYTAADYFFEEGDLYRIEVVAMIEARSEIVRLLSEKYGAPLTETSVTSNGVGTQIPVTRYVWRSKSGEMVLTAPALRLDRITLILTDKNAEAEIQKIDQSARPDAGRI